MNKDNEKKFRDKYREMRNEHPNDSALYEGIDIEENSKFTPRKKKKKTGLYIAAAAAFIIVLSSTLSILITNGAVTAARDKVWDSVNRIIGNEYMISDEEVYIPINSLDDTDSIRKAEDIMPNLIMPDTILDGYTFSSGSVSKSGKVFTTSLFVYVKGDKTATFGQEIFSDEAQIGVEKDALIQKYEGGTLFIKNNVDGEIGQNLLIYIKENQKISLFAYESVQDMEKYVKEEIIPNLK